ncbi:gliding motility-associated C-terminal domain-containing protein [Flagellimonas algicola]|uniref:Gliding motility-associated C-terminal domain-containing protein n=1 Tax=Flagellimonas algicola TaxID=2583815 RepID=A0ABY2WKI6_9FLAO|nr:gliding motility-associated C-terminal domain-containing protein [Allomuricauda algicola]TMU55081.1 gliding motility-associated C-terminal domain-containing protein [Allomuricauda algicola]
MRKTSSYNHIFAIAIALMSLGTNAISAQVLNKPVAADNPNLAGNSAWTAACASDSFNEYFVNFTWSPPLVASDNEFVLELSDANGNFGSPVELARLDDKNATFDFEFEFQVPNDVRGESYKMRVRSTNPAKTSPPSDAYPMHFVDFSSPLLISQDGSGDIPPGGSIQLCGAGDVTLEPHNISNADTYIYNWYRSGTLLAEKGASITVSTPGMYYVELDYGSVCSGSANTLSNTIEISTGTSSGIALNGADDVGLCAGDAYQLEANISGIGLTYTWYKDGSVVSGPTLEQTTFDINTSVSGFEGSYEVEVDGPSACLERSASVTIRNLGDFEVTRENDANIVLLPSQTTTLSASSTAASPSYQWYKDGSPITSATNSSLEISEIGDYHVRVIETGGGCSASPVDSPTTTVEAPESFEFVVEYAGAYTSCQSADVTLSLLRINAVSDTGAKTDVTSELESTFTYQWMHDGSPVSGETSKTMTISNFENNGGYSLTGTVDSFNAASNGLAVTMSASTTLSISANGTVLCEGADAIRFDTSETLGGETFEWLRDGEVIDTTTENITATEVGVYQLRILTHDCPIVSNELEVRAFDESLLSIDRPEELIIVEGDTETITASGAESYQWFDAENNLLGAQDSYGFQEEGEYLLVASFGNCTVSRVINVTYRDLFAIPNVITANGDGINDLWVLPNSYSRQDDVLVTIYDERGKEVFSQTNYENNWPQSVTQFNKLNMIFYYRVTREGESLKQGTITVIR